MGLFIAGIIALVVGVVLAIHILWIIGLIALVIGLILLVVPGIPGRPAGRRYRHWY